MSFTLNQVCKVWIEVKHVKDCISEDEQNGIVKQVVFPAFSTQQETLEIIRSTFNLEENGFVYKLRNHRCSLIPVNNRLRNNSKSTPYQLDVVPVHQSVKACPKMSQISDHQMALQKLLQSFTERIARLESEVPNLKNKREEKISTEIEDLKRTVSFLDKRVDDTKTSKWQGMFQKHPLW